MSIRQHTSATSVTTMAVSTSHAPTHRYLCNPEHQRIIRQLPGPLNGLFERIIRPLTRAGTDDGTAFIWSGWHPGGGRISWGITGGGGDVGPWVGVRVVGSVCVCVCVGGCVCGCPA